jgi:molybdopterin molybdotransferase
MISYREAQEIILAETRSFGTEIIGLDDADGRILAEDIFADRDYPPFNRSAMDGYAVMIDDWEKGIREFQVQQIIYAGTTPDAALRPGSAFKIMTGAAVPYPADTVIRKEDTLESGGKISFTVNSLKRHRNIAQQGEDLKKGALALSRHTQCSPTVISTFAS